MTFSSPALLSILTAAIVLVALAVIVVFCGILRLAQHVADIDVEWQLERGIAPCPPRQHRLRKDAASGGFDQFHAEDIAR